MQPTGTRLEVGDDYAELETVKVTQGAPSPVAGAVVEASPALERTPEVVNEDPYGGGWLMVVDAPAWEAEEAARRSLSSAMGWAAPVRSPSSRPLGSSPSATGPGLSARRGRTGSSPSPLEVLGLFEMASGQGRAANHRHAAEALGLLSSARSELGDEVRRTDSFRAAPDPMFDRWRALGRAAAANSG